MSSVWLVLLSLPAASTALLAYAPSAAVPVPCRSRSRAVCMKKQKKKSVNAASEVAGAERMMKLKAEGEAVITLPTEMQGLYETAVTAKVAKAEERLTALKAEGEAVIARRVEMQSAFETSFATGSVTAAEAAETAELRLAALKAEGEAAIARRARSQMAYEAIASDAAVKAKMAAKTKVEALRAEGAVAIARREEMQSAYTTSNLVLDSLAVEDAMQKDYEARAFARVEARAAAAEGGSEAAPAPSEAESASAQDPAALQEQYTRAKQTAAVAGAAAEAEQSDLLKAKELYEKAKERADALQEAVEAEAAAASAPGSAADSTGAEPAGALAREINLPLVVTDALAAADLLDPSAMTREDQDNSLSAIAATTAALFLLPLFEIGLFGDLTLSAIFGGGLASYAALRKDAVGSLTRDVGGKSSREAFDAAKKFERDNQLTEKAIDQAGKIVDQIATDVKKRL